MRCKFCQSHMTARYGVRRGIQYYICRKCGHTFAGTDAPEGMRTPTKHIALAVSLFYDGLPLTKTKGQLQQLYSNDVETSTVYRWIVKYSRKAGTIMEPLKANTGSTWVVDETVIELDGKNTWFWDIIDEKTRFLLASHISRSRTIRDVETLLRKAVDNASQRPHFIISDGLAAYPEGVERVFGAEARHIRMKDMTHEVNTNLIERFHSTLKQRTKIMRGLKTPESAKVILDGFLVNYNFFRPHMSLKRKTPPEVAGIKRPVRNWEELVRYQP